VEQIAFDTPTEEGQARQLDALGIRWEYEPDEFPLEYHPDGSIKSAFRPDFYLPDLDRYVEVTGQTKLTKKNRKMRLMAELYPHVEVHLLSRRELAVLA
jgi:hypothetical protein